MDEKIYKLTKLQLNLFPFTHSHTKSMILVTGGTGLVGSHLLFDLAKKGENIRALKRENSILTTLKLNMSLCSTMVLSLNRLV